MRTIIGKTFRKRAAAAVTAVCIALTASSCGLIPKEEEEHKLNIVTEDVSSRYKLAMAEIRDVELTSNIVCTYSRLNEEELCFQVTGYRVNGIYVQEGDEVKAGDRLASLDMSAVLAQIEACSETITGNELLIRQNEEMIAFYAARIASPDYNLMDKEEYTLKAGECEEIINECRSSIERAKEIIEEDKLLVDGSVLYAPADGTVSFIKKDLSGMYPDEDTVVMKLVDSSECAFVAVNQEAAGYMKTGDRVGITRAGGGSWSAALTFTDPESGRMIFELDEPDYSINIGTRANVTLVLESAEQVLAVPRICLHETEGRYYVYRLTEDGVREPVDVEVGLIGNNYAEITGGIELYTSVIAR